MNNEERDRRVMLVLNQLGIARSIQAYCEEWKRQFGTEPPPQDATPRFPNLPCPPFPTGPPTPGLAIEHEDWRDRRMKLLDSELWEANKKARYFEGFWERAAAALGMQHPPRLVDDIPPERQYQRMNARFDDGWREFTEEDVLGYLRSIGRISGGIKIVNGRKR